MRWHNIFRFSVWTLLYVAFLASRLLRLCLNVWRNLRTCLKGRYYVSEKPVAIIFMAECSATLHDTASHYRIL